MKLRKIGLSALAAVAVSGVLALSSCGKGSTTTTGTGTQTTTTSQTTTTTTEVNDVLSYAEYVATADGETVTISGIISGRCTFDTSKNAASFYLQDQDGGYYIYNLPCTATEYEETLTVGTEIKVTGYKTSWSGEVEIGGSQSGEEATFEVIGTGSVEPKLVTMDGLVDVPNQYVKLENLTVVGQTDANENTLACFHNWDNSGTSSIGTDLYYTVTDGTTTYQFVVEAWLENTQYGSETYQAVEGLSIGDIINIEGFAYTYNNPQVQTTKVTVVNQSK